MVIVMTRGTQPTPAGDAGLVLVVVVMVMATVFVFVVSVRMSIVVAEWFVELGGGERSRGTCRSAAVGIRPRQEGVYSKSGNG
mmetsp:Transcript_109725/g.319024  ORF Transcript_109725/g.319024 Transcript_109725/m.319024 type:complete len:83 (-) Transcript_109725:92-340(-)